MEQKQPEDAAIVSERKRKLETMIKDTTMAKQLLLDELALLDEVLNVIKTDFKWQWVPDEISYSAQCLTWSTFGMQNVTLQIMDDLSIEVVDHDGDTKTFNSAKDALGHVDQLLQHRALPRVRQLIQDLKKVPNADLRTLFRQQLNRWAVAFQDFQLLDVNTNQPHEASITVFLCDIYCLVKAEGSPNPRVWFPDHMVRLLSLPEA